MGLTETDWKRYARQMLLPGFGEAEQAKLRGGTALVTRCGGSGGPIALYLEQFTVTCSTPEKAQPRHWLGLGRAPQIMVATSDR